MPVDGNGDARIGAALVVGGGIGGMQAALDLAASGIKVYLADRKPGVGGIMAQLDKTFPTNDCAMCTMAPRLVDLGRNPDVEILSLSDVERIEGKRGRFHVTMRRRARYVDESRCTGCGSCAAACPVRYRVQPIPEEAWRRPDPGPEVSTAVTEIVARWKDRPGPLMPILQGINARFNYFPRGSLELVARAMDVPLTHLYRIASFYGAFSLTPRGRHTVSVCMGTTCYVRGSERLMDRFQTSLGIRVDETTPDRLFTLKAVRCIGCCGLAPAVMVGPDVHAKVSVKDVATILSGCDRGEAAA